MAGHVGLNQCAEVSIAGGDEPVYVAFDKVERGGMDYEGGEVQENIGLGGQTVYYRDMVVPTATMRTMLQSLGLLQDTTEVDPEDHVFHWRPSEVGGLPVPWALLHGGIVDEEDGAREHSDVYLRSVKFSCQVGQPVMAEYATAALLEVEATTIDAEDVAAKQTATPFVWHTASVEIDGDELSCQSWDLEIVNEFKARTSEDAKDTGAQRLPEWMDPGEYRVSLTATVRVNPGHDLSADFPDAFTFEFTAKNSDGTPLVFHIDCTGGDGFQPDGDPIELVSGADEVLYQVRGKATNDLDLVAMSMEEEEE